MASARNAQQIVTCCQGHPRRGLDTSSVIRETIFPRAIVGTGTTIIIRLRTIIIVWATTVIARRFTPLPQLLQLTQRNDSLTLEIRCHERTRSVGNRLTEPGDAITQHIRLALTRGGATEIIVYFEITIVTETVPIRIFPVVRLVGTLVLKLRQLLLNGVNLALDCGPHGIVPCVVQAYSV
mgnify:CR=1 FL=1